MVLGLGLGTSWLDQITDACWVTVFSNDPRTSLVSALSLIGEEHGTGRQAMDRVGGRTKMRGDRRSGGVET